MINTAPTCRACIIHHYDFAQQGGWGGVQHAVDGAQQCGPGLVVEHDDHAGRGKRGTPAEFTLHTPEGWKLVLR